MLAHLEKWDLEEIKTVHVIILPNSKKIKMKKSWNGNEMDAGLKLLQQISQQM